MGSSSGSCWRALAAAQSATSRTSTLQAEVTQAVAEGFAVSALVSCDEHIAVLEREVR